MGEYDCGGYGLWYGMVIGMAERRGWYCGLFHDSEREGIWIFTDG